ncbi:MAG TPA: bacterial Ig-like domain-containing protein [Candidatus Mediterraneibacter norwichensis]|nr:bacterial Ig-like domain-containing protein [Candidatus Mediterraneibacter norwichensis]
MRKKKAGTRRVLAAFLALALAGSYIPSIPASAEEPDADLLLDFDFEGLQGGQAITTETASASGGYTLTTSYDGSQALHLDGTSSQWLNVTKADGTSLLTGLEEMTISYDIQNERTGTNWALYAAPSDATQGNPNGEHYIGFLHNSGNLTVERYNQPAGTSRPTCPSVFIGSEWIHIDAVLSGTDTAIYVNGIEQARVDSAYSLTDILGDNSILQIGKANWGSGEYTQASIDNLKIWGAALTAEEIRQQVPDVFLQQSLDDLKAQVSANSGITLENGKSVLPDYSGTVTWRDSSLSQIQISEDGVTVNVAAPEVGAEDLTGTLTAVITLGSLSATVENIPVTVKAQVGPDDPYGYLMVHFVEDSAGYAEKIYLDISRGDNPEQWDPLNGRNPILASNLGTTGTRDPFITYNPETETYYIIATDLRVFNANDPSWNNGNWGAWASQGSTMMNVWESKDLITWSNVRQIDVSLDSNDNTAAYLGMMWAPEATWVDDYYGEGQGAFVVYWSSNVYSDAAHTQSDGGSDIMWGATTDFTQDTWEFGGVMLDGGQAGCIDTNILQDGGRTYHITKSQASGEEIIMEYTDEKEWWLVGSDRDSNYQWTRVQTAIGADWYGAVEGPASFKDHSVDNRWYLFVDDLPTPGYQPMVSTDLDSGWDHLDTSNYFLTSYTKHGGVISLTKAQYDAIRNADATSAVNTELGTVEITAGSTADELQAQLPQTAEVNLAYDMGTSELPVVWDLSSVNLDEADTYTVTGVVQSISANTDDWVGDGGSTLHTAANKELYSSRAIEVTAQVNVTTPAEPTEPEGNVTDLTLESAPAKLEYVQGEELDLTGLVMNALYENGYTDQIQAADGGFEVSGYDAQQIGEQTVTVSFGGQSVSFTVNVTAKEDPSPVFTGITIANLPDKTEYVQGEELDLTGIIVEAHYSDTSVIKLQEGENGYTVSGYDAQQIGEQTITISYNGDSVTFAVNVKAKDDPQQPTDPEDPQQPANPDDTEDPDGGQQPADQDDTKTPSGSGQDKSDNEVQKAVQTGDTTNVMLPIAGIGAAIVLAAAARRRVSK